MMRCFQSVLGIPSLALSVSIAASLTTPAKRRPTRKYETASQGNSQAAPVVVQPRERLIGHKRQVDVLAFSPDGNILATGAEESAARLWDVVTGQLKATLPGHEDVSRLSFSPDGRTIEIGSYQKTVRLWDVETARLKTKLVGEKTLINSVAFSPDSRTVATASLIEVAVRLWDAQTGALEATLSHEGDKRCRFCMDAGNSVAFSPDGRTIAASIFSRVYLWDAATKKLKMTLVDGSYTHEVQVTSHGRSEQQVLTFSHADTVYLVAFSPDGRTLATASRDSTANCGTCRPGG